MGTRGDGDKQGGMGTKILRLGTRVGDKGIPGLGTRRDGDKRVSSLETRVFRLGTRVGDKGVPGLGIKVLWLGTRDGDESQGWGQRPWFRDGGSQDGDTGPGLSR